MAKSDAILAIKKLAAAFSKEPEAGTVAVYVEMLSGVNPERLRGAVDRLLRSTRFFPTIAEILQEAEPKSQTCTRCGVELLQRKSMSLGTCNACRSGESAAGIRSLERVRK